ncbi:MAG: YbgC/FadM family acyl-CoA thioesterase [bacterium]|nr:YbgC/FadM family acyl-CoA thioesterase [bacterium]
MAPAVYKTTFQVRSYECDAYGHLNNANYLRYMQEAAIQASAAVGWDDARYQQIGHVWLIHETDIEYLAPVRLGDRVEITTWVADFRRVRSRRSYELRNQNGDLVARATTDWVYLNRATGQPASIPAAMIADFAPPDLATPADVTDTLRMSSSRARFPPAPPPPPGVYIHTHTVEWRDVDTEQHVNNATYLNFMEEAGFRAARHFGWSVNRMRAEHFGIFARRIQIEYRQQAALNDELTITTYLSDVKRANSTRHFIVMRASDGALIAQARGLYVFVNPQTAQITRLPHEILEDFKAHIAE